MLQTTPQGCGIVVNTHLFIFACPLNAALTFMDSLLAVTDSPSKFLLTFLLTLSDLPRLTNLGEYSHCRIVEEKEFYISTQSFRKKPTKENFKLKSITTT
jgi:hypothetical protein